MVSVASVVRIKCHHFVAPHMETGFKVIIRNKSLITFLFIETSALLLILNKSQLKTNVYISSLFGKNVGPQNTLSYIHRRGRVTRTC